MEQINRIWDYVKSNVLPPNYTPADVAFAAAKMLMVKEACSLAARIGIALTSVAVLSMRDLAIPFAVLFIFMLIVDIRRNSALQTGNYSNALDFKTQLMPVVRTCLKTARRIPIYTAEMGKKLAAWIGSKLDLPPTATYMITALVFIAPTLEIAQILPENYLFKTIALNAIALTTQYAARQFHQQDSADDGGRFDHYGN